jgi:N,N-dimethylformamidase
MEIVGYTDRWSVAAGETLSVMVSCRRPRYRASLVRMRHGDINPKGPGLRVIEVPSALDGDYAGKEQRIHPGSYVRVDDRGVLAPAGSFSLSCWVYPTGARRGPQALLGRWLESEKQGYLLHLTEDGRLAFRVDGADVIGQAPQERAWSLAVASFDAAKGTLTLTQQLTNVFHAGGPQRATAASPLRRAGAPAVPFLMAAAQLQPDTGPQTRGCFFNGRLDRPAVYGRMLDPADIAQLAAGVEPAAFSGVLAAWDFGQAFDSARAVEVGGAGLEGRVVNLPGRGVTGHNWSTRASNFADTPQEYAAIHFHDDDLEDAAWEVGHRLTIDPSWQSGVYAIRLTAGDFTDYVPFAIRPARGRAKAKIAFLLPTMTYLAYANEHLPTTKGRLLDALGLGVDQFLAQYATPHDAAIFKYMLEQRLSSTYERHPDDDPIAYGTRLRPMPNLHPPYNKPNLRFKYPHMLLCDLYITDWMEQKSFDFEVIDDETLHDEGLSLLAPYKVIVTGSHPEYWSLAMMTALRRYQAQGGRIMYLGGNGFYWVISKDRERPHIVEVRRGFVGTRSLTGEPGEGYHSTTGEPGGLWRTRGIPPQALVGVGFASASGLEPARPYRRTPESHDPAVAFIFEGVENEVFGEAGIHLEGGAGWELDVVDARLGTPPETVVLAKSFGHTDAFQRAIEDLVEVSPNHGGTKDPEVRSDVVYTPGPNGAAIFSVGSMSWCGCLSHNDYDNDVSRITENVLRAFSQ